MQLLTTAPQALVKKVIKYLCINSKKLNRQWIYMYFMHIYKTLVSKTKLIIISTSSIFKVQAMTQQYFLDMIHTNWFCTDREWNYIETKV